MNVCVGARVGPLHQPSPHTHPTYHPPLNPRSRAVMQRHLDVSRFKAAYVVADTLWAAGGERGPLLLSQAEMLSLDSAVLMVQLNIRLLLEEAGISPISIICEKLT